MEAIHRETGATAGVSSSWDDTAEEHVPVQDIHDTISGHTDPLPEEFIWDAPIYLHALYGSSRLTPLLPSMSMS